jgi:hypothetical protein
LVVLAVAQAMVLAAFVLPAPLEHVAHACGNAVLLSLDKGTAKVAEAQAALDEGDVLLARELTADVREGEFGDDPEGAAGNRLSARAERIWALSYVRDRDASSWELERVAETLTNVQKASTEPTIQADRGEAYACIPRRKDEAFAILAPLAKRDLVGSPYALGALVRLASERNDVDTATRARERCEGMIGTSSICRGDYPRAPLIRGNTSSYLPPLILTLAALALRLIRSSRQTRRGTDDRGRPRFAPWIGHAAALQAFAILGAAFYVFAHPTHPGWTTTVLGLVLALGTTAERRGFFAAVRRGKIPGLVLRPTGADDAHLPAVALYRGPQNGETLEQDRSEPGYREAARIPLLRLARRKLPLGLSFVAATAIAAVVLVGLLAVFAMFMTLRSY